MAFDEFDTGSGGTSQSIDDRIAAALSGPVQAAPVADGGVQQQDDTLPAGDDTLTGASDTLAGGDTLPGGSDTLPAGDDTLVAADDAIDFEEAKGAKFKVPLKRGEEEVVEEVTLDELRNGYMRDKDYHAKRQEDAGKVRQVQQQAVEAVGRTQQQFGQALQELDAFVQAVSMGEFQNVDFNKLASESPAEYVRAKARWDQLQTARGAIQQHLRNVEAQRTQAEQQRIAQAVEQTNAQLPTLIPNWSPELRGKMDKTAMEAYGFQASELAAIRDPRVMRVLHDAFQFRTQPNKEAIAAKKVTGVPVVLKPGAKPVNQNAQRDQQLKDRIRKSGGTDKRAIEERIRLRLGGR